MKRLLALAALLCACGPDYAFKQARHDEARGRVLDAVRGYERFAAKYPDDARAGEADFRAGTLLARNLGRCPEARPHFEEAARAGGAFAEPAKLALMACPDYFPLPEGGTWTFVDTLSGGQNMRLELAVKVSSPGVAGTVSGRFYAGDKAFRDYTRAYEKSDWTVWELEEGKKSPILRWPYTQGRSWTVERDGGPVTFTIESDRASVSVKGGTFTDCLKVRSQVKGFASWVYDYYCPGVGRAKTSVGVPGAENPNTELAKFAAGG